MGAVCQSAVWLCRAYGVEATGRLREAPGRTRIAYCLAEPSPYAVLIGSRKVAGFALRRYRESWLIHGSLLVRPLPRVVTRWLPEAVAERLALRAVALSEVGGVAVSEAEVAQRWAACWPSWWEARRRRSLAEAVPLAV